MPNYQYGENLAPRPESEEGDGIEIFDEEPTIADEKTRIGINPLKAESAPAKEKKLLSPAEIEGRSRFILEFIDDEMKAFFTALPEDLPKWLDSLVEDERLKIDPRLAGSPVSEEDIRLTVALLAESARRNAEANQNTEIKETAERLIYLSEGVNADRVGDMLHGAILAAAKGNPNDPYFRKVSDLAAKKGL
jgi:hypothetical protein